ncbi:hypothetical protein FVEG_01675 [Fusarium verticillioides 7600]|uniref:VOC domain-containing protein n=1 Tax=Gibberella moniliformis (strain M3125 / FGSC 7600) TaxID=334819 RepID=W7LSM8_GIBM7|nr:hypothetical protein FVEG_01675 [Fusarium verticillioides 7600]EWG38470.1 hypothetical protein FVEG_01675 [Fusarium verticillioides 7600]
MASHNPTEGFRFNHIGLRVADLDRSIAFYSGIFGMKVVGRKEMKIATLVFLAYPDTAPPNTSMVAREGVLELVYSKSATSSGDHLAFPLIKLAFTVPDTPAAMEYIKSNNVKVLKDAGIASGPEEVARFVGSTPSDLQLDDEMWNALTAVPLIEDPDGYLIEIIPNSFESS